MMLYCVCDTCIWRGYITKCDSTNGNARRCLGAYCKLGVKFSVVATAVIKALTFLSFFLCLLTSLFLSSFPAPRL